ncbi:MAG: hypothetical protein WAZ36_00650 [Sediminibacterium sp.]
MNESKTHLAFVSEEAGKGYTYAIKKTESIVQTFAVCMLERLHAGSEAVKLLFEQYVAVHRKFDYSIGILMRSMLLDYMILLNTFDIIHTYEEDPPKMEELLNHFCLTMLSDSAYHALKYFKANVDIIPAEKLKGMYSMLVYLHQECFESYAHDGTEPVLKIKKMISQAQMVNRLKKSTHLSHLSRKEDWYMYYSKYDHFGKMYHGLSKRPLPDEFSNMGLAIRELPRSLALMLTLLAIVFPTDAIIIAQFEKAKLYAEALRKKEDAEIDALINKKAN